jgi:hypothetical protein
MIQSKRIRRSERLLGLGLVSEYENKFENKIDCSLSNPKGKLFGLESNLPSKVSK